MGNFSASQICAGHKNDLSLEINGSQGSIAWRVEHPDELWIGKRGSPNQLLAKDARLFDENAVPYAALPGGHEEGWPDAFRNLMRNIFTFIAEERDPRTADGILFSRFDEGCRSAAILDAILRSHSDDGRWTKVEYEI
jgi:hypothetical protein